MRTAFKTHGPGGYMPKPPLKDIKQVWTDYKKSKSDALRNALMENYLHLVRYNAERIHVKLPDEVELDDLMSAGIFGLMDAINAFDLDRGIKFETYCAPRIRGAILDELRSMDWVERLVRSRANKLTAAARELEAELGQHEPKGNDRETGRAIDPIRETQRRDLKRLIATGLSRAERLIVILYY